MTENNNTQEVDLSILLDRISGFFGSFFKLIYHFINFLIKSTLILVILLIVGVVIGWFWERSTETNLTTNIILEANLSSTPYLYEAVENLEQKLKDKDTTYLKNNALKSKNSGIIKIDIEPVSDIGNILDNYKDYDDEQVLMLLEKVEADDEFFNARTFRGNYQYHKLAITVTPSTSPEIIKEVLNYLENNEYLQKRRQLTIENLQSQLEDNLFTITEIDTLFKNTNTHILSDKKSQNQVVVFGDNTINLQGILSEKSQLININNSIRQDLVTLEKIFPVVNNPQFVKDRTFFDKKIIIIPIALILSFIVLSILFKLFLKLKQHSEG